MFNMQQHIIDLLENSEEISSESINIPNNQLHGVLLSLKSKEQVDFDIKSIRKIQLTELGRQFLEKGSDEYLLYCSIPEEGLNIKEIDQNVLRYGFKNNLLKKEKDLIFRKAEMGQDITQDLIKKVLDLEVQKIFENTGFKNEFALLKKRNLIDEEKLNVYYIRKGSKYGELTDALCELTSNLVVNFDNQKFKKYNFNSLGNIPQAGSLHPLMKMQTEIKNTFIELGFVEMATNQYIESSFYNFDCTFQPQNHPSRDTQDTFFLKNPAKTTNFDEELFEAVKEMHSKGNGDCLGYQSEWKEEDAMQNVLRTHTTAVTARHLRLLAKDFKPIKMFSIDKVFRNETVDKTHLAEFHQVEGLIAGYDLGLSELMGIISCFFEKLGITNIKYKPAYNPYTEPSMEVFGYHPGLKKWMEIGNSGVFRPEMLLPLGLPENATVLGFGLSVERPSMIKYEKSNIRDLVGHKVSLDFIKNSPFAFFE